METEAHTNTRSNLILVFIFGFVFAVFVSSFVFISPLISVLILILAGSITLAEKIHNRILSPEALVLVVVLISFSLGSLRYSIKDFHEPIVPSETGIVISEPEERENFRRFVMEGDNGEKVLVSAPLYSPVKYGDQVKVSGKLERPGIFQNEISGRDFDYGKFLSKDDIYWTLSFAEVEILSSGHGNSLKLALFKFKGRFVENAKEILPEPQAGLLSGLIVSGKNSLPKDILESFRLAGVIHIVVLSGYNITLIAEFLRKLFQNLFIYFKLPAIPQAAAGASILGIILFVLMAGAQATIVRAAIMAIVVVGAQMFGRKYSASRALIFAGFLMLLENPKILVFDPSFQLSFLATLGLINLMPGIEKYLSCVALAKWEKLREIVAQTISTQLAVLPLLIYSIGDISLVSLPANILTLLVVPYTMLIGFLAILASFITPIIAWPLAFASHLLLSWILFVSDIFGNLPFASLSIPPISFWLVAGVYLVSSFAIIFLRSRNFPRFFSS